MWELGGKMKNNTVQRMAKCVAVAIVAYGGIMVAFSGGIQAAYGNGALYVSAESDAFENHFAGAQIIEVVVNDYQYRNNLDGDVSYTPIVTVDDNVLPMYQAKNGNWYGYFVELDRATEAQYIGLLMFGGYNSTCGVSGTISECDGTDESGMFVYVEEGRNVLAEPPVHLPIYAFQFTEGNDIDVELENGLYTETVTLTYDTVEDYAGLVLDREVYPQKAHVHVEITDVWLNVDPTSEDVWYFNTVGDHTASYRGTGGYVALQDTNLMCDDNCVLVVNPDRQRTSGMESLLRVASNADHMVTENDTTHYTIRFEEEDSNSGIFTNRDDNDESNVRIADGANRGTTATIDYNDAPMNILVGNGFAGIDMKLDYEENGNTWNSGEEIPIIIVDMDANRNSLSDEDMLVSDPDAIIPTMVIGSPFTLDEDSTVWVNGDMRPARTEEFSKRGILSQNGPNYGETVVIVYEGQSLNSLLDVMTGFKGYGYFNYHFESFAERIDGVILTVHDDALDRALVLEGCRSHDTDIAADCLTDAGIATVAENDDGVFEDLPCHEILVRDSRAHGFVGVDLADIASDSGCDRNGDVAVVVSFGHRDDQGTYQDLPFVADFMSFGYEDDGVQGGERVANQIIRIEAEETDDDTGIFEGSLEYVMVNQLNVLDKETYDGIEPITDEATFVVFEDMTDEDAPKVTYLDLGSDGTYTQVSARQEAPSHSGKVYFDSNRYKIADTVTVTLEDADLNTDSDRVDVYSVVRDKSSIVFGSVGSVVVYDGAEVVEPFGKLGRLFDITFDDVKWVTSDECTLDDGSTGLDDAGFTLVETDVATGIFTGSFQIPSEWCRPGSSMPETTAGLDMGVNYVDFRDSSGEIRKVNDARYGSGTR